EPIARAADMSISPPRATTTSVDAPPRSTSAHSRRDAWRLAAPRKLSSASRLPEIIRTGTPMISPACRANTRPSEARRTAAVAQRTRVERDSMGEMQVPADAYYGASTQRAVLNFPISGQAMPRRFIRALGMVKRAAAQTNRELGLLPRRRARAIAAAAQEVIDGKLDDQFPIDVYQTGSGTSTNTNANEVIANRATEILGGERGSKLVHPNDHVNLCQSSNDVIPTAIQLAAAMAIQEELVPALERLQRALEAKSKEFWPVIKTGRTHLQDATPIRLGQEFRGYAGQVEESIRRARAAINELARIPLGGTAVGTGIN